MSTLITVFDEMHECCARNTWVSTFRDMKSTHIDISLSLKMQLCVVTTG